MKRETGNGNRQSGHVPRFYLDTPLARGDSVELIDEQAHHLRTVLRGQPGDAVILFNGRGGEYTGEISDLGKKHVSVAIRAHHQPARESPLQLTLAQGIARGDRMDFAIAKAVELGVQAIQPLFTERGKVSLRGQRLEKKHRHWQRVAASAAEQSGRERLPQVAEPQAVLDWLKSDINGNRIALDPDGPGGLQSIQASQSATLLVGPESGLSAMELAAAEHANFKRVRFGPRVLRTETAGVAALAALQTLWGDLG